MASDLDGNVFCIHCDSLFIYILRPWLDLRCYQFCSEHSKEEINISRTGSFSNYIAICNINQKELDKLRSLDNINALPSAIMILLKCRDMLCLSHLKVHSCDWCHRPQVYLYWTDDVFLGLGIIKLCCIAKQLRQSYMQNADVLPNFWTGCMFLHFLSFSLGNTWTLKASCLLISQTNFQGGR